MFRRHAPLLICLVVATATATVALAQPGGGAGRRGGGRGGDSGPTGARPPPASKPFKQPEIVGVVKALDPATGRITIAYDTVEALGWPPGTQPFPVAKSALMNGVSVGEKVRFSLDSGQIATISDFDAPREPAPRQPAR